MLWLGWPRRISQKRSRCRFDVLVAATWCSHKDICLPFEERIFLTKLMTFFCCFWMKHCAQFICCVSIAELLINQPTCSSSCVGGGLVLQSFSPRTGSQRGGCSQFDAPFSLDTCSSWWFLPISLLVKMTHGRSWLACRFLLTEPLVFGSFAHLFVGHVHAQQSFSAVPFLSPHGALP